MVLVTRLVVSLIKSAGMSLKAQEFCNVSHTSTCVCLCRYRPSLQQSRESCTDQSRQPHSSSSRTSVICMTREIVCKPTQCHIRGLRPYRHTRTHTCADTLWHETPARQYDDSCGKCSICKLLSFPRACAFCFAVLSDVAHCDHAHLKQH
jgi:hypothetical protein